MQINDNDIHAQVIKIRERGILARSNHLNSLFEFLYSCYQTGRVPKEFEIAVEGMGRTDGFDVTQDAMVRVYIHKLRRKLDDFYEKEGEQFTTRIVIPKGEYRLTLETVVARADFPIVDKPSHRFPQKIIWSVLAISALLNVLQFLKPSWQGYSHPENVATALWEPLLIDERPNVIVVGDYYIFAETDGRDVKRLVRDFDLNSAMDLANYLQLYPERAERQFDVGLSYLPTSTAYALNKLSPSINNNRKTASVILASALTPEILRASNIIYIGHLSGLGLLSDIVFDISGFHIGSGFDELVDNQSGEHYLNDNSTQIQRTNNISHLAYLSSFTGPNANRIIIISGFRDEGLKELVDNLLSADGMKAIDKLASGNAFEAIYRATGYGHTITPAKLVKLKPITRRFNANE